MLCSTQFARPTSVEADLTQEVFTVPVTNTQEFDRAGSFGININMVVQRFSDRRPWFEGLFPLAPLELLDRRLPQQQG